MNWNRSIVLSVTVIIVLWVFVFLVSGNSQHHEAVKRSGSSILNSKSEVVRGPITFLFAGDIMLSRAIGTIMEKKEDFTFPYALMDDSVRSADIAFANLETPVSINGTNVGSIYSFRTNPQALAGLKGAGFDVVSIANNHIWDYGRVAFMDTIKNLDEYGIKHAGGGANFGEAHTPAFVEAHGRKVAVLAYTSLVPPFLSNPASVPAVAYPNIKQIAKDIDLAKANGSDIVVVSFHWGTEYSLEHDAEQERIAHAAIDAGALIVVGHHPHVVQEIERYKGGLIMYSLGNFIFDQNFSPDTNHGLIVRVTVGTDGTIKTEPLEVRFNPNYQPFVAGAWH